MQIAEKAENAEKAEAAIWAALDMEEVGRKMETALLGADAVAMGTGRTSNACYMCDGSNTTAGCNGCG